MWVLKRLSMSVTACLSPQIAAIEYWKLKWLRRGRGNLWNQRYRTQQLNSEGESSSLLCLWVGQSTPGASLEPSNPTASCPVGSTSGEWANLLQPGRWPHALLHTPRLLIWLPSRRQRNGTLRCCAFLPFLHTFARRLPHRVGLKCLSLLACCPRRRPGSVCPWGHQLEGGPRRQERKWAVCLHSS